MGVVLNEQVAVGGVDKLHRMATGVGLDLLQALGGWRGGPLGFHKGQGQRVRMAGQVGTQQVVHPAPAALERLAVQAVDTHRALLAVDLAVAGALGIVHPLYPLRGIQRGINQLGTGVGFVVAVSWYGG